MTSSHERKSRLNIVMGAMTFGDAGTEGARVHNTKDIEAILDVFTKHGHTEIDTARVYASGTSERLLGEIDWKSKGLKLETKLYPNQRDPNDVIDHTPEGLRKHLKRSMEALKTDCLEMWYLHAPDRSVPYEITLKTVHELYKEGLFKRFGISNYAAWEVAEIVGICKANGYIQPTAYQGIYNAVHRAVEPELFPCLRKYGISFYEFNPLGGGFFTGRYNNLKPEDASVEAGSRFDPDRVQGKNYRQRYWKEPYFQAIDIIRASAERHGLTQAEVALRWLSHHSYMSPDHEDAVLIGASSLNHIEQNLVDLEKGPLPEDVVKDLDAAWQLVKPHASSYFVPFPV